MTTGIRYGRACASGSMNPTAGKVPLYSTLVFTSCGSSCWVIMHALTDPTPTRLRLDAEAIHV